MKAGTAKVVITPSDPMGRVMVMGSKATGVMHDIYARALVLDDGAKKLVIVTYDLNCLDVATPIIRSRCLHELGIEPAYLVMMATHNHAAPIQITPSNFDYGRVLADKIFNLIKDAIAEERGPVKLYFGSGPGDFVRSDPRYPRVYGWTGKPVDNEVQLLKVTEGDKTIALLFNQATHPMASSFSRINPSHPGYAMDELERKIPGALAMYADACGGDQFATIGEIMLAPLWQVKQLSRRLAKTVLEISSGKMIEVTGGIKSELKVISLPLGAPISYQAARELAESKKIKTDVAFIPYPQNGRGSNWLRSLLQHYDQRIPFPTRSDEYICTDDAFLVKQLPEPREFPCNFEEAIVAAIGPLIFVSMQGEVCAPIGKRIKDTFRKDRPIMVSAYMGEHNLYIPTRRLVEIEAYQSQVIQSQYASPVGWSPEVEDEMVKTVNNIIEEIIR